MTEKDNVLFNTTLHGVVHQSFLCLALNVLFCLMQIPDCDNTDTCVHCAGGAAVDSTGQPTNPPESCENACGGQCCTSPDSSNELACSGFTGTVVKDGSCAGPYACRDSSISLVSGPSCVGDEGELYCARNLCVPLIMVIQMQI